MSSHDQKSVLGSQGPAPASSAIREPVRRQLAADVAEFLARGGRIEEVPINRRADPPRRADGDYGRGAI
ncbi:MAG: hypothetical protein RIB46_18880 [Pseudomonadales bacterium]|jgi:hypothetical protein